MNAKQYLVVAILLNVVLLAFAAAFWPTKRGANEPGPTALTGPSGRFGPAIETVLPLAKNTVRASTVSNTEDEEIAAKPDCYEKPASLDQSEHDESNAQQCEEMSVAHGACSGLT